MVAEHSKIQELLVGLIDPDRLAPATPSDAVDGVQPAVVVEPASVEEAATVMRWANQVGLKVAPRGGGSKMGWGNIPSAIDLILSTRRLNKVLEHAAADMTVTIQAGVTLSDLSHTLSSEGQMLALDPPFADVATVGGLIATNDSGPLRLRFGGVRDQLLGVTLVRADGVVARGGGKVVKNVAGYDLPKLVSGSYGTLAVVIQATFRLYPLPDVSQTVLVQAEDVNALKDLIPGVLDSTLVPTGLALTWSGGPGCKLFLRFSGIVPSVASQIEQARDLIAKQQLQAEMLPEEVGAAWRDLVSGPWSGSEPAIVARLSVLPTEIPTALLALQEILEDTHSKANAVVQAHGLGLIRIEAPGPAESNLDDLIAVVDELRRRIGQQGGTLTILSAPLPFKRRLDVWGAANDAMPLMRRIKAQLDPKNTLNPGRFMGGL
jgi:glycolate oxidase FAD binding subunit